MKLTQQYYTAEVQEIQIAIEFQLFYAATPAMGPYDEIRKFQVSLKVISDVFVTKKTSDVLSSVRDQEVNNDLGYSPIATTFARGGRVTENPFQDIATALNINLSGWAYNLPVYDPATVLSKRSYISNVSASPAGQSTEITVTNSLYLYAPVFFIQAQQNYDPSAFQ